MFAASGDKFDPVRKPIVILNNFFCKFSLAVFDYIFGELDD